MKQVLVIGFLGFENFGDEALLHVLIGDLLKVGITKENITAISANPNATVLIHGVGATSRLNLFGFINALLNSKAVIFIGGLFQDKTSFRSIVYYCLLLLVAAVAGKEIIFYGVGIGPLQRKISQVLFNSSTRFVHLLTVRDQGSAYLTPHKEFTTVTCDPVWSIESDFTFKSVLKDVNWQLPILGVSMRNDKNLKGQHVINIADKLARVLVGMKEWQLLLIPCMFTEDISVLYELENLINKKINAPNRIILLENFSQFSISQQAGILASCDVMIGMRYHALLVPLANGKPVFGLIYDQKVKSLLEFSGQVGASFREDFDQVWSYFWQNLQHSSDKAKQAARKANELHKKNTELLYGLK